jgi:hypothetical protein
VRALKFVFVASLVSGLGGCADPLPDVIQTTAVDPSKIVGNAAVTSNGRAATIRLSWYAPGAPTLEVGPGDRLVMRAPDAPALDLARVGDAYYALLPTTATTVTIALLRPSGEIALDVPLPAPFVVSAPAGPVPRSQPIVLTWDPPTLGQDGPVDLTADSTCFGTVERRVAKDTGSFTFYPGDFGSGQASCTLSIAVKRTASVSVKTPWTMSVVARQVRTVQIETTP